MLCNPYPSVPTKYSDCTSNSTSVDNSKNVSVLFSSCFGVSIVELSPLCLNTFDQFGVKKNSIPQRFEIIKLKIWELSGIFDY